MCKLAVGTHPLCVTMSDSISAIPLMDSPVDTENGTPEKEMGSVTDPGPLTESLRAQLDTGNEYLNFRQKFWQIWCVTTAFA